MTHNYGERNCLTCGSSYLAVKNYQKFCSQKCQLKSHYVKGMSVINQYKRITGDWFKYLRRLSYKDSRSNLSATDLLDLLIKQNYKCALSGEQLTCNLSRGTVYLTNASIDRIVPGGPYTLDNIRLVCRIVNTMKWNMSDEELKSWCNKIVNFNGTQLQKRK